MSDYASFAAAVLADLDAAGPFADWLDERGDPRGKFLRVRWRRWKTERAYEVRVAAERAAEILKPFRHMIAGWRMAGAEVQVDQLAAHVSPSGRADASFRRYVAERFGAAPLAPTDEDLAAIPTGADSEGRT